MFPVVADRVRMGVVGRGGSPVPARRPPAVETHQQGEWRVITSKSHILSSAESEQLATQLDLPHLPDMVFPKAGRLKVNDRERCNEFLAFSDILTKFNFICTIEVEGSPALRFVHFTSLLLQNRVELRHSSGAAITFSPVEALKLVNNKEDLVHVSTSAAWLAARQDSQHLNNILHPYDWTFTTNYKGAYFSSL